MPELRRDPIVGRWVIIAAERGKRPTDYEHSVVTRSKKAGCPFCEGNEARTPSEIFVIRDPQSQINGPGWQVRVVPNKFPALRIEGNLDKAAEGIYDKMNGIGAHEVIIETPEHDLRMENQDINSLSKVFEAYQARLKDLENDPRFKYILIFKNEGSKAGATLEHPHAQLIATPVTPKRIKEQLLGAQQYFEYKDRSVFTDILNEELKIQLRIVYENNDFLAFCPYASRFPFEVHIYPKHHAPDFHTITPEERLSLAELMKVTMFKLSKVLSQPQYNYIIHTAPIRHKRRGYWSTLDQDFMWHIEIMPRLTQIAGFEWGSGFYINPVSPEEAAQYLREAGVPNQEPASSEVIIS